MTRIAAHLGQSQQNFHKWFDAKTQRRLWEHLPKILELFPDVRPEWLYMGQEPVFMDGEATGPKLTREHVAELEAEVARLKDELAEADRLNRKLAARLLVEGSGDKGEQTNISKASAGHG